MIPGPNQSVNESTPMASFGENLRREREMRGVTLQEISAATKISGRFLQALEAEEFAKVPGGVFTRSSTCGCASRQPSNRCTRFAPAASTQG